MKVHLESVKGPVAIDLSKPIGIHLEISNKQTRAAWYVSPPQIAPHVQGDFIGSIAQGAPVNFNDISFNPHAHGTHTECVGHILEGDYMVLDSLKQFFFETLLVSVKPQEKEGDLVISRSLLEAAIGVQKTPKALVMRTFPNTLDKKTRVYNHSNPAYLTAAAANYLKDLGVEHLLVDLPSVDKENDGGALLAHKAFWNVGGALRTNATITEFIFVPASLSDGTYFLQFGLAPFVNDACPSTVFLYEISNT